MNALSPRDRRGGLTAMALETENGAYERIPVDAPPDAVVTALRHALESRRITEYAVVDHARDLASAVDIPLRLAVIGAELGHSEIVLRDMRTLLADELADLAEVFNVVIRTLAAEARERAVGG